MVLVGPCTVIFTPNLLNLASLILRDHFQITILNCSSPLTDDGPLQFTHSLRANHGTTQLNSTRSMCTGKCSQIMNSKSLVTRFAVHNQSKAGPANYTEQQQIGLNNNNVILTWGPCSWWGWWCDVIDDDWTNLNLSMINCFTEYLQYIWHWVGRFVVNCLRHFTYSSYSLNCVYQDIRHSPALNGL